MHVISLGIRQFGQHLGLLSEMYRLRRRIFKVRLDWSVSVSGDLELDVFDALNPTYLIAVDHDTVTGCVRLLPTTGPTMLADTFPMLLDGQPAPRSDRILESSASASTPNSRLHVAITVSTAGHSSCLRR
jgi:acyl homoserine lactone synthase